MLIWRPLFQPSEELDLCGSVLQAWGWFFIEQGGSALLFWVCLFRCYHIQEGGHAKWRDFTMFPFQQWTFLSWKILTGLSLQLGFGFRNSAAETVEQELLFVGSETGKLLAMRELVKKVVLKWLSFSFLLADWAVRSARGTFLPGSCLSGQNLLSLLIYETCCA